MRENEQEVLEWVNWVREKHGLGDPLPALPPDATKEQLQARGPSLICPIAQALVPCGYRSVKLNDGVNVPIPDVVFKFMRNHDECVARS